MGWLQQDRADAIHDAIEASMFTGDFLYEFVHAVDRGGIDRVSAAADLRGQFLDGSRCTSRADDDGFLASQLAAEGGADASRCAENEVDGSHRKFARVSGEWVPASRSSFVQRTRLSEPAVSCLWFPLAGVLLFAREGPLDACFPSSEARRVGAIGARESRGAGGPSKSCPCIHDLVTSEAPWSTLARASSLAPHSQRLRPMNATTPFRSDVAILGAGMAGLAAAQVFRGAGLEVALLDKGRGVGGRTSTRRASPFAFDHGAQYFTARSSDFCARVAQWKEGGVIAPWEARFARSSAAGCQSIQTTEPRWVAVPGMNALAKHIARDFDLRVGSRVGRVERAENRWTLFDGEQRALGECGRLLITAPPRQAADLIGEASTLGAAARRIEMKACWAAMFGFGEPYQVEFDAAHCDDPTLSWIARNNSKPGRGPAESWVLHATPEWSGAHLELEPEEVLRQLAQSLSRLTGRELPRIEHRRAHRWLYALPKDVNEQALPNEQAFLFDEAKSLALAGDAYGGGRVESAYQSGAAAAKRMLES